MIYSLNRGWDGGEGGGRGAVYILQIQIMEREREWADNKNALFVSFTLHLAV